MWNRKKMDMEIGICLKSLGVLPIILTGIEQGPLPQLTSEDERPFVRNEQITFLETIPNKISD